MRLVIRASVDGKPVHQNDKQAGVTSTGRPYVYHRNGKALNLWRDSIADAVRDAYALDLENDYPVLGPCMVEMDIYLPRPMSHYLKSGTLRPDAPQMHSFTPDFDNLAKSVADAITRSGLWKDDCQASDVRVRKLYVTEDRPQPGLDLAVYSLA